MSTISYEGNAVAECLYCSGRWLTFDTIDRIAPPKERVLLLSGIRRIADEGVTSLRSCPDCTGKQLRAVMVGEIEIDACQICKGVFLDAGELGPDGLSKKKDNYETGPIEAMVLTELAGWVVIGLMLALTTTQC